MVKGLMIAFTRHTQANALRIRSCKCTGAQTSQILRYSNISYY